MYLFFKKDTPLHFPLNTNVKLKYFDSKAGRELEYNIPIQMQK